MEVQHRMIDAKQIRPHVASGRLMLHGSVHLVASLMTACSLVATETNLRKAYLAV